MTPLPSSMSNSSSSQALLRAKHLASNRIINALKSTESLARTTQLHAHIAVAGLLSPRLRSNLSRAYALRGHVAYARKLFDESRDRSSALHSAVMRMYLQKGLHCEAMRVFCRMVAEGKCRPDDYTFPFALKACGEAGRLGSGAAVHGRALAAGFASDAFVQNALLAMYLNCGDVDAARAVFSAMAERTVVAWNTMIGGCFRNGHAGAALAVFRRMVEEGFELNCATAVAVLPACGFVKDLTVGREVHAMVEEKGLERDLRACNALVDMYARCGEMGEAQTIFDKMGERDVVAWTTMINGYIMNGDEGSALALCAAMQSNGVRPNSVTLSLLLSACGSLSLPGLGRCLHCLAVKEQHTCNVVIETALIDMYAKCRHIDRSFRVFAKASRHSTAPWSAIIAGYTHNGLPREAIGLFQHMLREGVRPNDATLSSVLPSYAAFVDFRQAMGLHCYLIRSGILSNVEVSTGFVDLYSKCGSLESAHKLFDEIPERSQDIIVWSVIIACYGRHGQGEAAMSLFNRMVRSGVTPNQVTFTSVLHACSHSGLVDEGLLLFKSMLESKRLSLQTDHYTCIVDLLGRAGRLEEAYDLIKGMTFLPNHAIWGALLGACVIHENVELGEIAAKWLFELEPENTGNYVLMAKIYAAAGRWKDAEDVREMMDEIGLRKSPAHSLIESGR